MNQREVLQTLGNHTRASEYKISDFTQQINVLLKDRYDKSEPFTESLEGRFERLSLDPIAFYTWMSALLTLTIFDISCDRYTMDIRQDSMVAKRQMFGGRGCTVTQIIGANRKMLYAMAGGW